MSNSTHSQHLIQRIPGQAFLWSAVLIFGSSSAIIRKLTQLGSQHLIGSHNPVSLCNILFVGNLCALSLLLVLNWRQLNPDSLRRLTLKEWLGLAMVAALSGALAPGLFFQALSETAVNNVVLVGRLEPPLTIALSVWLLKERVNTWEIAGAATAFTGVALTIFLQPPAANMMEMGGYHVGVGELLTAGAALASSTATLIGRSWLMRVSVGLFSIGRTAIGTVIFFLTAQVLYGSHHFMEALSPFLWKWMALYGAIIVVAGQSFWLKGMRASGIAAAALAASFTPIASILAAYVILRETPTAAQYIGGSVILIGILLSQVGSGRRRRALGLSAATGHLKATSQQALERKMGFKGI